MSYPYGVIIVFVKVGEMYGDRIRRSAALSELLTYREIVAKVIVSQCCVTKVQIRKELKRWIVSIAHLLEAVFDYDTIGLKFVPVSSSGICEKDVVFWLYRSGI